MNVAENIFPIKKEFLKVFIICLIQNEMHNQTRKMDTNSPCISLLTFQYAS